MIMQEMCTVVKQRQLTETIFELILAGKIVNKMAMPGQFVHIKVSESTDPLLRRPISICSIDQANQQFTIIYRVKGQGTELLSTKRAGDVIDVLGPLGNGFPVKEVAPGETALLIGGGVGTPPLYELSKQLVAKGAQVVHLFGYDSQAAIFYEREFTALGPVKIATVDGSAGHHGVVTDLLAKVTDQFTTAFACGPSLMLKALQQNLHNKKFFISLEERMGCGIGACFACVCETTDKANSSYKKICSDGPVFRAAEVVIK